MGNKNEGYLGGIMGGESRVAGGGGLKSTGILSLEEAGTQAAGDLTLPQLSWGGITGRSVLTEGSAAVPGDDDWDDVTLLLDGSGTTDLSTASPTVTPSGSGYTTGNTSGAKFGQYIDFQNSGYFNVALPSALGVNDEPFTVECWAYFDNLVSDGVFQLLGPGKSLDGTADGNETIALAVANSNTWVVYDQGSNTGNLGSVTTGTWYHTAAVYDGTDLKFYLDGAELHSATRTMSAGGYPNVAIGGYFATSFVMDGRIEDFRVTKGVARYSSNFTRPTESFPTNLSVAATSQSLANTGIFTLEEIYELTKAN